MLLREDGKKRRGDGTLAGGGLPVESERLPCGHDVRARLLRRGDERANDCANDIRTDVFPHD
jgi:hypothetical protein